MKWRCTWCGKPHAENDPPCDACGHNTFEKAVVRVDDETQSETESDVDTDADFGSELTESGTVDTGPDYVWACPNCGREHVRNTPPCSRCGNPDLERVEQTYEGLERDLETPSWFAVAKPYLPILVVIGVIVALFATGVISPSILPGIGPPSPPDAPGDGTEAAGIDLEATEGEIHDRLEADRDESRAVDDGLAAYSEYYNRAYVANEYGDADHEPPELSDFNADCSGDHVVRQVPGVLTIDDYDDERELAEDIVGALRSNDDVTRTGYDAEGLDIHVVDGSVYVIYTTC
ncbi:hypothetical protein CP556_19615 [Natrinema sp. CBA1119]|uniref:hypothetical protein n=1 Tax=Natrinema sp. CBA1119 TaxID=1608465 RepID=UPI000BF5F73B|nr:hypothetical protein [Natrinema sp. CBA1119]PGF18090.1 hypothetical protein CP556_19615 [Natrinema sp. CBA1119]